MAALVALGGCVRTRPFKDSDGRVLPGSIASMETIRIGGIDQSIWFRGISTENPALILLHGGPGASESALFRHYDAALERHFLVVYWEQRGTGRSYHFDIPSQSMTVAQFLRDLDEVVDLVRRRFHKKKVVLIGHSWGTVLGTIYAWQHPEKIAAYVGVAQVADVPEQRRLSYEFALSQARKRGDQEAIAELLPLGPQPHTVSALLTVGKWTERFGGTFHADLSTGKLIWVALNTDEADLTDLVRFGLGNRFSLESLEGEISGLRLDEHYLDFDVPVFFVLGRHDWHVPSVVAAAYFDELRAPYKRLVWFEASAHNPSFEEPDKFDRVLVDAVLPVVTSRASVLSR
jgi:pimeloyl-ACP methyl ester carboxylesterase